MVTILTRHRGPEKKNRTRPRACQTPTVRCARDASYSRSFRWRERAYSGPVSSFIANRRTRSIARVPPELLDTQQPQKVLLR